MEFLTSARLKEMNPAVLAFVGDAVFSLFVKERLAKLSDEKSGALSRKAARLINATAQARFFELLSPDFTPEEADVARRARNQHKKNTAKSALPEDYKKSTALEAVIGYNYLAGDTARLKRLMERLFEQQQ